MANIDNTPIAMLTARQLKDYLFGDGQQEREAPPTPSNKDGKRYLYGVNGLAKFLNVSYPTAWKLKETKLKSAVYQQGRVIMIDADKVLELMSNENNG